MTGGKCARCGAEDSMFWYPYAFGVAPIPSVTDRCVDRCQYFNLCDKCQQEFVDFMHNKKWPFFDADKIKQMMENTKPVILTDPEVNE